MSWGSHTGQIPNGSAGSLEISAANPDSVVTIGGTSGELRVGGRHPESNGTSTAWPGPHVRVGNHDVELGPVGRPPHISENRGDDEAIVVGDQAGPARALAGADLVGELELVPFDPALTLGGQNPPAVDLVGEEPASDGGEL